MPMLVVLPHPIARAMAHALHAAAAHIPRVVLPPTVGPVVLRESSEVATAWREDRGEPGMSARGGPEA